MKLIILDKNWDNQEKEILKNYEFVENIDKTKYVLCKVEQEIFVRFPGDNDSFYKIDFLDGKFLFRLKTLSKNQPLFKALSIADKLEIIDCTAGLGRDAMCFAYLGANVTAYEENPVVYLLLNNAIEKAFKNKEFKSQIKGALKLEYGSSKKILEQVTNFDCAYIDPMYPQEEDKSALPKKEILFLREILPETTNLEELLENAIKNTKKRVVLKRPSKADFVLKKPAHSYESKMVRFDLYLSQK